MRNTRVETSPSFRGGQGELKCPRLSIEGGKTEHIPFIRVMSSINFRMLYQTEEKQTP